MLDVQGCSKVTVKVNGSDALSSKRNSSLSGSETCKRKLLFDHQSFECTYTNVLGSPPQDKFHFDEIEVVTKNC